MNEIESKFREASRLYNRGEHHYTLCYDLVKTCLQKIENDAEIVNYGLFLGSPNITYHVAKISNTVSRPFHEKN